MLKLQDPAKTIKFLLSGGAALCLFLSPAIPSLLLSGGIALALCAAAGYTPVRPEKTSRKFPAVCAVLITALIAFFGFYRFYTTWSPSDKAAALASALGISLPVCLTILGLLGCIAGLYSLWKLGRWLADILCSFLKEKLPEKRKEGILANLKRNWLLPISAMAFFGLNATLTTGYLIAMLLAFAISVVMASQIPSIFALGRKGSPLAKGIAALSAAGICLACQTLSYADWNTHIPQAWGAMLPFHVDVAGVISIFGAVCALGFVYLYLLLFLLELKRVLAGMKPACRVSRGEAAVYILLIAASLSLMVIAFARSQAFYGTDFTCDIIYTSDSPMLVKRNVYVALANLENDLRQPLFAVFASPFVGIPCLLGKLLPLPASVQAMLLNSVQILLLFAANFLLANMLRLSRVNRIAFMVLSSLTYTHLLFILAMEQYIVAYFWLILCISLICERNRPHKIALWGAGGTLLTSMILLPAMSEHSPLKSLRAWLEDMVKHGLEFMAILLALCRFDVIYNFSENMLMLRSFTGKSVAFAQKVYQYFAFVGDCFLAPDAGIYRSLPERISWQLDMPTGISIAGLLILLLCLVSAIWNRSKKSSRIAAGWIVFSAVLLLGAGWGTRENGLILYALYFGWAFLVLLFQLAENIGETLHLRFLVPAAAGVCALLLAVINIPAIAEMLEFAIRYYPA